MVLTIGCVAFSHIASHGQTAKPHTEECRTRIGEQMKHDPEGHERWPVHKHKQRRNVEPDVEVDKMRADPALLKQLDVGMLVETLGESASVKRGAEAAADNEERARLRLRAEGKRGQTHDMQDVLGAPSQDDGQAGAQEECQKRESTQPLPDLEEAVKSTVLVVSGSAPIQEARS